MTELRTRDAVEADLDAVLRIRSRSFGPLENGGDSWWQAVSQEALGGRMIVVTDGDTIVGAGRIRPYEQAWGGRHQPMGGVAGVYVEPSERGRGVAKTLMRGLIARMGELGDAVSCLYPTAPVLYRSVGYEFGGSHPKLTYAAESLRGLRSIADGLRPRQARGDDAEWMHTVLREQQERDRLCGPHLTSAAQLRKAIEGNEDILYVLDGSDGGPRGFVNYALRDETLLVDELVGESEAAVGTLWSVVASGSSAAPRVATFLDPRDASRLILPAAPEVDQRAWEWMLRVVDLPKAVAARGFSPHVTAEATFAVNDGDAPLNTGVWRVSASGGAARLTAADETPDLVQFGPRGVAALWSGWGMSRLRLAGLAVGGDPAADSALDAIFDCQPFMTEYF